MVDDLRSVSPAGALWSLAVPRASGSLSSNLLGSILPRLFASLLLMVLRRTERHTSWFQSRRNCWTLSPFPGITISTYAPFWCGGTFHSLLPWLQYQLQTPSKWYSGQHRLTHWTLCPDGIVETHPPTNRISFLLKVLIKTIALHHWYSEEVLSGR